MGRHGPGSTGAERDGPFENKTHAKVNLRRAFEAVGACLRNTPTVCRTCYVHPEVVACYLEGGPRKVRATAIKGNAGLPGEERAVLRLLERRLKRKPALEGRTDLMRGTGPQGR